MSDNPTPVIPVTQSTAEPTVTPESITQPTETNPTELPNPSILTGLPKDIEKIFGLKSIVFHQTASREYEVLSERDMQRVFQARDIFSSKYCSNTGVEVFCIPKNEIIFQIELKSTGWFSSNSSAVICSPPGKQIGLVLHNIGWYNETFEVFDSDQNTSFIAEPHLRGGSRVPDFEVTTKNKTSIGRVSINVNFLGNELTLRWMDDDSGSVTTEMKVLGLGFIIFMYLRVQGRYSVRKRDSPPPYISKATSRVTNYRSSPQAISYPSTAYYGKYSDPYYSPYFHHEYQPPSHHSSYWWGEPSRPNVTYVTNNTNNCDTCKSKSQYSSSGQPSSACGPADEPSTSTNAEKPKQSVYKTLASNNPNRDPSANNACGPADDPSPGYTSHRTSPAYASSDYGGSYTRSGNAHHTSSWKGNSGLTGGLFNVAGGGGSHSASRSHYSTASSSESSSRRTRKEGGGGGPFGGLSSVASNHSGSSARSSRSAKSTGSGGGGLFGGLASVAGSSTRRKKS